MSKLDKWKEWLSEAELADYSRAGHGNAKFGIGQRVALLNVDSHNMFVDPKYPFCGTQDPDATIAAIAELTDAFRQLNLPIYYVRRDDRDHPVKRGMRDVRYETLRNEQNADPSIAKDVYADEWPASYAPRPEDVIVYKNKSSAFFGTPLEAWLRYEAIDTLVICGLVTSGCVRATVTDAFAHNFRNIVVAEACADRSPTQHKANLFDMDMKFADVESLDSVASELKSRFGQSHRYAQGAE
ncbi:MAG: isochorismatase family protein [Rhodospirillaceae bacterium]|jgi:nicotinamidase-related amidase